MRARFPQRDRQIEGRMYYDTRGRFWPCSQGCEHCDGECGPWVRSDAPRGLVCPRCDDALDEMFDEIGDDEAAPRFHEIEAHGGNWGGP